jgi:D-threo-aldose 1-dehydrogenase
MTNIFRPWTLLPSRRSERPGSSERRLGLGLRDVPRGEITVSTKVGRVLQDDTGEIPPTFEYTPDAIARSLEGSRARLGLDRFDIVHVHDPERHLQAAIEGGSRRCARCRLRARSVQ